ncbi:MAG: N-methyl-D-aspartate receptor NMDAR2C subunit [Myxococcota bacterium]
MTRSEESASSGTALCTEPAEHKRLKARFVDVFRAVCHPLAEGSDRPGSVSALADALLVAWNQPHRAYHRLAHLRTCLELLDEFSQEATATLSPSTRAELELALWFHDAVYDPRAVDNEARSARWAEEAISPFAPATAGRVAELVRCTAHHQAAVNDRAAELLLDIDLAVLGFSTELYDAFEAGVREEYQWVELGQYVLARTRVLQGFLDRETIFRTAEFRERLEARARVNLRRAIGRLAEVECG